jgi:hypothetical protein
MNITKKEILNKIEEWIKSEEDFNQRLLDDDNLAPKEIEKLETYLNGKIRGMKLLSEIIQSQLINK